MTGQLPSPSSSSRTGPKADWLAAVLPALLSPLSAALCAGLDFVEHGCSPFWAHRTGFFIATAFAAGGLTPLRRTSRKIWRSREQTKSHQRRSGDGCTRCVLFRILVLL